MYGLFAFESVARSQSVTLWHERSQAKPSHAKPNHTIPCYAMRCDTMPCHTVLHQTKLNQTGQDMNWFWMVEQCVRESIS